MGWLTQILIVVQVICAVSVIFLILLQHGKGADMGAAFGGGASGSLFGASGSANFLSRTTAVLATIFFLATIGLAYTATAARSGAAHSDGGGVMSNVGKPAQPPAGNAGQIPPTAAPAPAAPATPPAKNNAGPGDRPADIPK